MNTIKKIIATVGIVAFFAQSAMAQTCFPSPSGNYTTTSSCSFIGTANGVDNGNLTVGTGTTLTVNANQTIVWNPGFNIRFSSSSAIAVSQSSAKLLQSYLWMNDADGDGWTSATNTMIASDEGSYSPWSSTSTGNGADGSLTVSGTTYTDSTRTGVSTTSNSGQKVVSVTSATGFSAGLLWAIILLIRIRMMEVRRRRL
jgi:hypothetical protein